MPLHDCANPSHVTLSAPFLPNKKCLGGVQSSQPSEPDFCLTCFLCCISSMSHADLSENVKHLADRLGRCNLPKEEREPSHCSSPHKSITMSWSGPFSFAATLREIIEAVTWRMCTLSRDKQVTGLKTGLKRLIVDFVTVLTTHKEAGDTSYLPTQSETWNMDVLGMSSGDDTLLCNSHQRMQEGQQRSGACSSLARLVAGLIKLLRDFFTKGEGAAAYCFLLFLSDVYESCSAFRVTSCVHLVDFLRLYTAEMAARQGSSTIEVYLYLLYQLFMECRQRPELLESLSSAILSLSSPPLAGLEVASSARLPVFISSLCVTIEQHSQAQITIRNALSLIYLLVSLETTAKVVLGDTSDPTSLSVAECTLHYIVPLILHPNAEVSLLACETSRMMVKRRSPFGISIGMREWVTDLALEGIQLASRPSATSLIGLLNSLYDNSAPSVVGQTPEVEFESATGLNPSVLASIFQLSALSNDAFQDAVNGIFLQKYLNKNAANVDLFADQILHALEDHSLPSFESFVRLLYLLSGLSSDIAAIRPEISSLLVQHTLRQLKTKLASILRCSSLAQTSEESHPTLETLLMQCECAVLDWLGCHAFREFFQVVSHFLPVSDELLPLSVHLLMEMRQGCSKWSVSSRMDCHECKATLHMAHHLITRYLSTKDDLSADTVPRGWCFRLQHFFREGLLDWLLLISVGHDNADVEKERAGLVQSVVRHHRWCITEDTTRGAASCKELLLRDSSPHQMSHLLASLAALGCPAPLDKEYMVMLLHREFSHLVQLLANQQVLLSGFEESIQLDLVVQEDETATQFRLGDAMDAITNVLQISAAHYKYFGSISKDLGLVSTAKAVELSSDESIYALIPRSSFLREGVWKLVAALDREGCESRGTEKDPVEDTKSAVPFKGGQILAELLNNIQMGKLGLHVLLALILTALDHIWGGKGLNSAFWHRLLTTVAASDVSNMFFATFFQFVRQLGRWDVRKQVGLVRLLDSWMCSIELRDATAFRVNLLERHVIPYLLTDRAGSCAGEVMSCMGMLLIDTVSPLPPSQSNACDIVIFKWSVRGLTEAWTAEDGAYSNSIGGIVRRSPRSSSPTANLCLPLNVMVLLHLLLERSHAQEMSAHYGEVLLPVLSNMESVVMNQYMTKADPLSFYAATVVLLCGLLKDSIRTGSSHIFGRRRESQLAATTKALKRCWTCLPIRQCHKFIHCVCQKWTGGEERTALLLRLKTQVVSAFQFILLNQIGSVGGDSAITEDMHHGAPCADDEYSAALFVVNWCLELVLAQEAFWAEAACDLIHILFHHYRKTLATSQEVLLIYLSCLKGNASMLPTAQLGILVSALLYVSPHLPWSPNGTRVHALVHRFLSIVDPTALASTLGWNQSSQGATQIEPASSVVNGVNPTVKMYTALSNACRYYACAVPQASPLSLHRFVDFVIVRSVGTDNAPSPVRLFLQNRNNVNLFTEYTPL